MLQSQLRMAPSDGPEPWALRSRQVQGVLWRGALAKSGHPVCSLECSVGDTGIVLPWPGKRSRLAFLVHCCRRVQEELASAAQAHHDACHRGLPIAGLAQLLARGTCDLLPAFQRSAVPAAHGRPAVLSDRRRHAGPC